MIAELEHCIRYGKTRSFFITWCPLVLNWQLLGFNHPVHKYHSNPVQLSMGPTGSKTQGSLQLYPTGARTMDCSWQQEMWWKVCLSLPFITRHSVGKQIQYLYMIATSQFSHRACHFCCTHSKLCLYTWPGVYEAKYH